MIVRRHALRMLACAWGAAAAGGGSMAAAGEGRQDFRFASIDGGEIGLGDWPGQPVLVVNTASLCAFTPQYDALQALYDRYRDRGLVVLAVPSDDFGQELGSEEAVRDFCEMSFGLDLPMTTITPVTGPEAHPLFLWLAREARFTPRWNFNKALIGADGTVLGTWGSRDDPLGRSITGAVEAALGP